MEADSGQQDARKPVAGVGTAPMVPSGPRVARLPAAPTAASHPGHIPTPTPFFPTPSSPMPSLPVEQVAVVNFTHGLWVLPRELLSSCKNLALLSYRVLEETPLYLKVMRRRVSELETALAPK